MGWKIEFDAKAEKEFRKLDRQAQTAIAVYLREKILLSDDPRLHGKHLKGEYAGLWRYRVGDYRIICDIRDKILTIVILKTAHRKDAYR